MNLANLILLAVAAAVYPTLLAGVILILSRPHPVRMMLAFLIGGMTISIAAGIGIAKWLEDSGTVTQSHPSTAPVLDIVAGAISLVMAWGIQSGRIRGDYVRRVKEKRQSQRTGKPAFTERALGGGSVTMAVIAGVALNLPGIWYLCALSGIAQAQLSTATALLEIVLFNVIMFILIEVPLVAYLVNSDRATAMVTGLRDSARRDSRRIAIVVAAVIGVWLIVKGIVKLV